MPAARPATKSHQEPPCDQCRVYYGGIRGLCLRYLPEAGPGMLSRAAFRVGLRQASVPQRIGVLCGEHVKNASAFRSRSVSAAFAKLKREEPAVSVV